MNLVELLVVIGVAAILTGLGVSSYKYITNSSRVSGEINGILGDMQYARSEAIKRGQYVSVCPSSDGATCSTSAAWTSGWIVFSNWAGDGVVNTASPNNDTVLRIQAAWTSSDALTVNNSSISHVTFNRNGLATGLPTDGTDFVIILNTTPVNTTWKRCLDITMAGAMKTERYGDSSGNC